MNRHLLEPDLSYSLRLAGWLEQEGERLRQEAAMSGAMPGEVGTCLRIKGPVHEWRSDYV